MAKILLVDDEDRFRANLAKRLTLRGYSVVEEDNGVDAIKRVRADEAIEVVVLDIHMPGGDGMKALRELKVFRPALQVIMLTGHGSIDSAKDAGRFDAFKYLQKPCDLEELIAAIKEAKTEGGFARERHELPKRIEDGSWFRWWLGSHNSRPLFIALGLAVFSVLVLLPVPDRLVELLSSPKSAALDPENPDPNFGYADYRKMAPGVNVADFYSGKYGLGTTEKPEDGAKIKRPLTPTAVGFRAKVMLALILLAALFWATGAVPVAVTALLVAVVMYFFGVFKPNDIAMAFAKDAVIFIFGVLALSKAISKTGLDRRIGLLLLAPAKNLTLLLLVFLPLLSVACSFISEHALVAFAMPLFVMVYATAVRGAGIKKDRSLMVLFALSLCYAANSGGPGSPAAGGRNAIMVGILADYGVAPSFGQWTMYGLPMVPVMSFAVGVYFWLFVRPKTLIGKLDVAAVVRNASQQIGPMTWREKVTAAVLVLVIILWITCSGWLGMGGPVIFGLVLLNVLRVLSWKDMSSIHWEVVFLYAGASAIGKGLAATGGALYLADGFVSILPDFLAAGAGLAIASSIFTGLSTNFMSDGATVAAVGPITVPMATIAGIHPWMVGYATAFASSFAHMLIIGTPSNALVFAMAKDPNTGEQLVTLGDFFRHGAAVVLISFLVLWFWTILGYWTWIGFPAA
ncbi:MAG: SLC13 family permease [Planctomycetota bacterium]|jgi:sodium-dependent dicarboxylate transporter 2/3/5